MVIPKISQVRSSVHAGDPAGKQNLNNGVKPRQSWHQERAKENSLKNKNATGPVRFLNRAVGRSESALHLSYGQGSNKKRVRTYGTCLCFTFVPSHVTVFSDLRASSASHGPEFTSGPLSHADMGRFPLRPAARRKNEFSRQFQDERTATCMTSLHAWKSSHSLYSLLDIVRLAISIGHFLNFGQKISLSSQLLLQVLERGIIPLHVLLCLASV